MRVLFSTISPRAYMAPPPLGDEQINCGPDWKDERDPSGRVTSLSTPLGSYDLAAVASRLPAEQAPDLVVCLVDASWRNLPRNLGAFKCPRVVLVGDTGHMQSPLVRMLQYLSTEPYHRVVLPYDRHHASIFRTAGFTRLHWFPGITFPHGDAAVRSARSHRREPVLAFTGQVGRFHPRRCRLVADLQRSGLPFVVRTIGQGEALRFYGGSLLGFNASLNGGVNLRVFEILSAGGALVTDRIAPVAGLDQILGEGRERVTYADGADLVERTRELLGDPRRASEIGAAGAAWFDRTLGEARRRKAFLELAFDGRDLPEFEFTESERRGRLFGGSLSHLVRAVSVYEGVQELHRVQESIRIALDPTVPADFAGLCATLPRAEVGACAPGQADYLAAGREGIRQRADATEARRVWCWDAEAGDLPALQAGLGAAYACRSQTPAVFERIPTLTVTRASAAPVPSECSAPA
jgi:hypothetical protein